MNENDECNEALIEQEDEDRLLAARLPLVCPLDGNRVLCHETNCKVRPQCYPYCDIFSKWFWEGVKNTQSKRMSGGDQPMPKEGWEQ